MLFSRPEPRAGGRFDDGVTEMKSSAGCLRPGWQLRKSLAGLKTTWKCLEDDVIVADDAR